MNKTPLIAIAIVLTVCTAATAQQFQFAGFQDVESAFASQQAKMAQLEAQLATFQDAIADPTQETLASDTVACCDTCCCGGWYAGAEVVYLKDHANDGYNAEHHEVGYRLYGGYERCDGLGIAMRYFDYDNGSDPEYGNELSYIDLELTTNLEICSTQILLSGGYRHADVKLQDNYANWNNLNGVTFGVRVQREIWCDISVFGWLQESFLYGTDEYSDEENGHINWQEAQLGLQYNTCWAGRHAWLRGGVEAHDFAASFDSYYYDSPGEFGYFLGGGVNY